MNPMLMQSYEPLAWNRYKYMFFTGKGGVGKTSTACATAARLASSGRTVLLVSTDPASNLDDVFGMQLGPEPEEIPQIPGLYGANLDPEEAARIYREKVVAPYRGILPDSALVQIEEQLSGACTVEIAAFDEFARLLADEQLAGRFDHILFDTAPTGHTLRLLQLPKAWTGFLDTNTHGGSCLGPLSGLSSKRMLYEATVSALSNPQQTAIFLVSRPDRGALAEAARASGELKELGIGNQSLIINGLLTTSGEDPYSKAYRRRQQQALDALPDALKALQSYRIPLQPFSLTGSERITDMFDSPAEAPVESSEEPHIPSTDTGGYPNGLSRVVDSLEARGRGLVMLMGKGGVGKTTLAAAIALGLAERGHHVRLTTTDPAAHLASTLGSENIGGHVDISRIDPKLETERYRQEVLSQSVPLLDQEGMELLQEDLASPCTEEIAVFRAFARTAAEAEHGFVVMDTAPTGHTLLLLDAAAAYHKEVQRAAADVPNEVKSLLPRLRNPEETQALIITLPEATPVYEAERLQADLHRAGIHPAWWIVNQSWSGLPTTDPVLSERGAREEQWIRLAADSADAYAVVPWTAEEPVGAKNLLQLLESKENGTHD